MGLIRHAYSEGRALVRDRMHDYPEGCHMLDRVGGI